MEKKHNIFISYKRVDKKRVFVIKDYIEKNVGASCWIDLEGIESDAQFVNVIMNAIDNSELFLFMYSKTHSIIKNYETDWTIREISYAQSSGKRIVFINIDKTPLTKYFVFMFPQKQQIDADSKEAMQRLCDDMRKWLHKDIKAEEFDNDTDLNTSKDSNVRNSISSSYKKIKQWILSKRKLLIIILCCCIVITLSWTILHKIISEYNSVENKAWRMTKRIDKIEEYKLFIDSFPYSKYIPTAKERIITYTCADENLEGLMMVFERTTSSDKVWNELNDSIESVINKYRVTANNNHKIVVDYFKDINKDYTKLEGVLDRARVIDGIASSIHYYCSIGAESNEMCNMHDQIFYWKENTPQSLIDYYNKELLHQIDEIDDLLVVEFYEQKRGVLHSPDDNTKAAYRKRLQSIYDYCYYSPGFVNTYNPNLGKEDDKGIEKVDFQLKIQMR